MNILFRGNLKTRLALLILVAIAPAFALYVYASYSQMNTQKNVVRESALRLVRVMKASHTQVIGDAVGVLRAMSQLSSVREEGERRCQVLETELAQKFPGYQNIGLATAGGEVICTSQRWSLGGAIGDLQFFNEVHSRHDIGMGRYRTDASHPVPYVIVGAPIIGMDNRIDTIMFASLRLEHFSTLPAAAQLPLGSTITVFDNTGLVFARFPDPQGWTGTRLANAPLVRLVRETPVEEGVTDVMGADNVSRLFAYSRIHRSAQQSVFLAIGIPAKLAYAEARRAFWSNMLVLGLVFLLVLGFAWIGAQRLVVRKMQSLIRLTDRVRGGDLGTRSGVVHTRDEVGQLAVAIDAMAEAIQSRVAALQRHGSQMRELKEMNDALQACVSQDEVLAVARQFALRLFPGHPGALYLAHPEGYFEAHAEWEAPSASREFQPEDCWAVRRGKSYRVDASDHQPRCRHVEQPPPNSYICVPLIVHGEVLGLLHLENAELESQHDFSVEEQPLAMAIAEPIALMLANLRLRETLHAQAMRDGLTGLYNRRFMEESLKRETGNAKRKNSEIAIMMIDIDHFKRFNDTFGHAAGDMLLRQMGRMLQTQMRVGDLACRYGGEEFTVILPGTGIPAATEIGEKLRSYAARLQLSTEGRALGQITISVGIAGFPQHGDAWESVLHAADVALLQAKLTRNRVVVYDSMDVPGENARAAV